MNTRRRVVGVLVAVASASLVLSAVHDAGAVQAHEADPHTDHSAVCAGLIDASETLLRGDCEVLLDIKSQLLGTSTNSFGPVNWGNDGVVFDNWNDITIETVNGNRRVTELDPFGRDMDGTIPARVADLSALTELRLDSNDLTGEIPSELGNLASLVELRLSSNELTGEIPSELGNLASLEELRLNNNDLTGEIPSELGNLTSLERLQLNSNDLTGSIPPELGGLSSVQYLFLQFNELTGAIPPELGNLTSLRTLSLYGNQLTGSIPSELGNLTSLTSLVLDGNQLTGSIPAELGNLTSLTSLVLNDNQLTGDIPSELGGLTSLRTLYLDGNDLTGPIPDPLRELSRLTYLRLGIAQVLDGFTVDMRLSSSTGGTTHLTLPTSALPDSFDPARTYARYESIGRFRIPQAARTPTDITLGTTYFQIEIVSEDVQGNDIEARLKEPAVLCLPEDTALTGNQYVYLLPDRLETWEGLPAPAVNPAGFETGFVCGETYRFTRVSRFGVGSADSAPVHSTEPYTVQRGITTFVGDEAQTGEDTFLVDFNEVQVLVDIARDGVAIPLTVAFARPYITVKVADSPQSPDGSLFALPDGAVYVAIDYIPNYDGAPENAELALPSTVCLSAPGTLTGNESLLHLGDGPSAEWEALPKPETIPEGYASGYVCGVTQQFSTFVVGSPIDGDYVEPIVIVASSRILRIEPGVRSVTLSAGDAVRLPVDVYGVQDILDSDLQGVDQMLWSDGSAGGSFSGSGNDIVYTAPTSPGRYTVTASLPNEVCRGGVERCRAEFEIRVRRSSLQPTPTQVPENPAGAIPSVLVDADGRQYEVFTPEEGGFFHGEDVTISAEPGVVPNLEIVGVRVDVAGAASNIGMAHHRYSLAGMWYEIRAVDADEAMVSGYVLQSPMEVCLPLPDVLRSNISDVALVSSNADESFTILSSSVRIMASGTRVCGGLSELPASVAVGRLGSPADLPTPTPEAGETELPDTGGRETPLFLAFLAVLLGSAVIIGAVIIILQGMRQKACMRQN